MKHRFLEVFACCLLVAISAGAGTPTILTQPQSVTINNASTATFTVVATNAVAYQWQFDANEIVGATNSTLTLDDVNTNQAGNYTVIVTSSTSLSVTSTPPATLTILPGTIVQFAISGYAGGDSNTLTVQLFDHDKPATVRNFLHYILAGAYTNIFWSRCVPGVLLQAGDYDVESRTNGSLQTFSVYESFTVDLNFSPPFPFEIDNEFNVGPLIPNEFGTLAMVSGESNSATNAFFFNLGDNSATLDNQNGGSTVFGRILSGTNILEYYNGLNKLAGGIYDNGAAPYTDLPVNYDGQTAPGNSNLFYIDFTFITPPAIETTTPTASIAYPSNGATTTNADLVVLGTATDAEGLARVICNFIFGENEFGGDAIGTTNWSFDAGNLAPGDYFISVESQNGAGYLSPNVEIPFTVPRFPFDAYTNGPGTLSTNLNGTSATIGSSYIISAIPDAGGAFVNWTIGTNVSLNPAESFVMSNGLQMTANFVSNTVPGIITLASPAANAQLTNQTFNISGTISSPHPPVRVTCQIFDPGTLQAIAPATTVIATNNFSVGVTNLSPGSYIMQAFAQDALGDGTVITNEFTVMADVTIITNFDGYLITNAPQYVAPGQQYSATAAPETEQIFYNWQNQGVMSLSPMQTFTVVSNITLTVTFVSNTLPAGLTITSPANNSRTQTANGGLTIIGTLPSSDAVTNVTCQLFSQSNAVTIARTAAINGTSWSLVVSNLLGGPYTLVVEAEDSSGLAGLVTESFTALVAPPAIISQPADITANTGSAADFTVTAGNAVSYQWELAGTGPIAGATNATLALDNVSTNQSGSSYMVVVTASDTESVTSRTAVLTVTNGTIVTLTISHFADGSSSNITLELFDHDKPATVANFIHYITSGAYSNMFFDRDIARFVLQGGDYGAVDRTTTAPGLSGWAISSKYVLGNTNFPQQVDSEFNVGPLIPNTFGTVAMALASDEPNSATSAFFFNLADNSSNLDTQNGGFTVFGRVLSGTNVLQYFNTLSAPSNGISDYFSQFPTLPVNYDGTNEPDDASLFFCDFTLTNAPVDTTPPTISITNPAPNEVFTNGSSLIVQGAAQDNVGLAEVFCTLVSSTGAYNNTNAATGTTNWSLNLGTLEAGIYRLTAFAQDGAGNLSAPATVYFTNFAQLTLNTVGGGSVSGSPGHNALPGVYSLKAVPNPGYIFYSWSDGVTTTLNPSKTISLLSSVTLTATFVPDDTSLRGVTFTYPPANAKLKSGTFSVAGRLPASLTFTQMTCQLFLQSNGVTALPQLVTIDAAEKKWTLPVTNLTPGPYTILAVAYDSAGNNRLVSENFNLLAKLAVGVEPPATGTVTAGLNGKYLEVGDTYRITATPKLGHVFAFWTGAVADEFGAETAFVMSSNTVLTANFTNNLFPAVAGTYTGLFVNPDNVSPTNAGFITVTTTGTGALSARMMFPSRAYPGSSKFFYNGFVGLAWKGLDSNYLDMFLQLDLTNGTDTITGFVADDVSASGDGPYIWSSSLILHRAVTRLSGANAPAAGKYVVLLQPEIAANAPVADGYAAISLGSGGALSLGGALPDNTAISESAKISKDGIWPVYIVPSVYRGKGMMIGWQTNTPAGACDGQLFWIRPPLGETYYPGGFAATLNSDGAQFMPPVADTAYPFALAGITNSLAVNKSRQFMPAGPVVGISLLPTGVLTGHIEVNNDKLPFKGAFISPAQGGAGFILEAGGQTGSFEISPVP